MSDPREEAQKQPVPGPKRSPKEQTAQKLLEQMERNKEARKQRRGVEKVKR
jgi:hypothetical protein